MNRINKLFENKKKDLLNIFLTAGYPELQDTGKIVKALELAGVDMVEIGMPYSDPLADGPTIQATSKKALENGMHLDLLFQQVREIRKDSDLPIVLMGYVNQMIRFGEDRFIQQCVESGVDGLILPDLPLIEFERYYAARFKEAGLATSLLVCPTTQAERIRKIDQLCSGFIYIVADAATTGAKSGISEKQVRYFERLKELKLKNPTMIGFGIFRP